MCGKSYDQYIGLPFGLCTKKLWHFDINFKDSTPSTFLCGLKIAEQINSQYPLNNYSALIGQFVLERTDKVLECHSLFDL